MKNLPVPIVKQKKMACGPTALHMVLLYYKHGIPLKEIIKSVGGIKSYGVKLIRLAKFARKLGYKVTCYSYNNKTAKDQAVIKKPSKADIIRFLKRKIPVIFCVKAFILDNKIEPSRGGHFIIITGYKNKVFSYNDSRNARSHKVKEEDLMFAWFNNIIHSSGYLLAIEPK